MFINLGSTHIQVSIVEYSGIKQGGKVTETFDVLSSTVNDYVGGYFIDLKLAYHFANEFDQLPSRKGKPSVTTSKNSM